MQKQKRTLYRASKTLSKDWANTFVLNSFETDPIFQSIKDSVETALESKRSELELMVKNAAGEFFAVVTEELVSGFNGEPVGLMIYPSAPGELRACVGGDESSVFPHQLAVSTKLKDIAKEVADYDNSELQAWRNSFAGALALIDKAIDKRRQKGE